MRSIHGNRRSLTTITTVVQPPLSSKQGCVVNRVQFPSPSSSFRFFLMNGKTGLWTGLQGLCTGNKAGKCLVARFETCSWSKGHLVCRHAFFEVTWGQRLHQDQVVVCDGCVYCGHRHPTGVFYAVVLTYDQSVSS